MDSIIFSGEATMVTADIRVSVGTAYLFEQSDPDLGRFVFAYKVTIHNESPYRVQLLRRKWLITDAMGRKRTVSGEGVIGKQPVLNPGESHEYISGCDFQTEIGEMRGFFYMIRHTDGQEFKIRVPRFVMAAPFTLN